MSTFLTKLKINLKSVQTVWGLAFELRVLLLEYRLKAILPDANQLMTRVRIRPN